MVLTWGRDDILPVLSGQAEDVAHHLPPAGLAVPVATAVLLPPSLLTALTTETTTTNYSVWSLDIHPYLVPIQSPQTKKTRRTGWSCLMSAQCSIRTTNIHQTSSILSPAISLCHWTCHCHKLMLNAVTPREKTIVSDTMNLLIFIHFLIPIQSFFLFAKGRKESDSNDIVIRQLRRWEIFSYHKIFFYVQVFFLKWKHCLLQYSTVL